MPQPTTRVWLYNGTESACWPVYDWETCQVKQSKYGQQTCDIAVRRDSVLGRQMIATTAAQIYLDYAIWVWHGATLLCSGPILNPELVAGADSFGAFVNIAAYGHLNAALLRRQNWTATNADFASGAPIPPNQIAINVINNAMGVITGPVYPPGYPGGVVRTNFGSNVYRAGVIVGAPAPVSVTEQSGNNAQDVIEELCQKFNMCPALRHTAPATRYIDIEYPYERNDRTGAVVLTRLRGTSVAFAMSVPYTLTTVARIAGSGGGATQTQSWATSGVATYGVHENQMTLPGGAASNTAQDAADMVRAATPQITYKVTARDTSQVQWCTDYFWRDGVLVYDADYGQTVDQTIVEYDYRAWNGGRAWEVDLTLGERAASTISHMASRTGQPFYKGAGTRFRDNRS